MDRFSFRHSRLPVDNIYDEREKIGLHELWPGRADSAAKIETKLEYSTNVLFQKFS